MPRHFGAHILPRAAAGRKEARAFRRLISMLLLASVGGCATVPKFGRHPEPLAPESLAAERSFAGAQAQWPHDNWWHDFGDPQLDGLISEAFAGSPSIDEAAARIRMAAAQADLAGAALLPKADALATARYSRLTQSIKLPTDGNWHLLGAGLINASYDIDLWGRNRAALRAAMSEERASEADAAATQLALATAVASTYIDLSQLYVRRSVTADALTVRKATLDLATRRFNAGIDPRTSMQQAEAGVEAATGDLAATDEAIALGRNAIAALLGKGPDRGLDLTPPQLSRRAAVGLPADVPIALIGRRPDIVSARWRMEAEARRIHAARAAFYPNVSLAGLIGVASFGFSNLFKEESIIGSAGPAVSLPIFDGGRLRASYRGAYARFDLAVTRYNATVLQALHEAADAATSLKAMEARQRAAEAALAQQESAYRLSRMKYEGGLSDYQAVLIVENALLEARDEAASLRLRGFVLDVALVNALGGGFAGKGPTPTPSIPTRQRDD